MREFMLCFIPLFVAIDPLGMVPIFVNVTADATAAGRRKLVMQALPTAGAIGVGFFLLGPWLLGFLNIQISDMQIAGGVLLFVYAMMDLFLPGKPSVRENESVGLVPLATPLIVGPAVLTLGPVLVSKFGALAAVGALLANLVLLGAALWVVEAVLKVVPINAMRAISKVVDLILAAIGVALVREGLMSVLG
jgi:multiple antibiotic resistance protein